MEKKAGDAGFTLTEILVVVVIIVILLLVVVALFIKSIQNARDARRRADIVSIAKAYEVAFRDGLYYELTGAQFSSNVIPRDEWRNADYYGLITGTAPAFRVCAALEGDPAPGGQCSIPSETCFCKTSSQGNLALIPGLTPALPPDSTPGPGLTITPFSTPVSTPFSTFPPVTPTVTSTLLPTPADTSVPPTATPTFVPIPECSFTGSQSLTVGEAGRYTSTTTGAVDVYYWETVAGPVSGTYVPSNIVSSVDWSTDTPGSYTIQLAVMGPGGVSACQNSSPIIVDQSGPTPTPTNNPAPSTRTPTNNPALPTPTPSVSPLPPSPSYKRVFVSSGIYSGNLGGRAGADAKCQSMADSVSLGGSWKAWLSDNTGSPYYDSSFTKSTVPYKLLYGGLLIANNWADLTDGTLANAIYLDERGWSAADVDIWTNTTTEGKMASTANADCGDWLQSISTSFGLIGENLLISNDEGYITDFRWTDANISRECSNNHRIYCFEQ